MLHKEIKSRVALGREMLETPFQRPSCCTRKESPVMYDTFSSPMADDRFYTRASEMTTFPRACPPSTYRSASAT
jgi:hypothetical protein